MFKEKSFFYSWLVFLLVSTIFLQACGNDMGTTLPALTPAISSGLTRDSTTTGVTTAVPATTIASTNAATPTLPPSATSNPTVAVTTSLAQTTSAVNMNGITATFTPENTIGEPTPATTSTSVPTTTSNTLVPRFEATVACPFVLPPGQIRNQTVQCGYVIVPETHAQPSNGKTLKIAVIIFKTKAANPAEPVIYLEGGPGGNSQSIIDAMTGDFYNGFTARGDAIFFDQRGVGNSRPELYCPEIEKQLEQDALTILKPADDAQHNIDSAIACHDRLVQQGVNLAVYNSIENAGDVNDIRLALGYQKLNVYGASYGTTLAQTVMRLYPQIVRSVVLDSVAPPDVNANITSIATGSRTMNLIFQACTADINCNKQYPDLKGLFTRAYNLLNSTQPTVKVTVPKTNATFNIKVDGRRFVSALFSLLYSKQTIQLIPKIIGLESTGNNTLLASIMTIPFETNLEFDMGMFYSVECAEAWPFSKPSDNEAVVAQSLPEFSQDSDIKLQASLTLCQKWNVPAVPQVQTTLLKSDIPTLVMEGQFDPVTPPVYGQKVAQNLSKSFYVEFPYNGHGEVVPDNVCAINIMKTFLENPSVRPDSSCTANLSITFS